MFICEECIITGAVILLHAATNLQFEMKVQKLRHHKGGIGKFIEEGGQMKCYIDRRHNLKKHICTSNDIDI